MNDMHAASLRPGVGLQAWRYRPWVQKIIDQQMRVLARQKGPTIGFHIRGGDLLRQDRLKVSTFCIEQDPSLTLRPCAHCLVESEAALQALPMLLELALLVTYLVQHWLHAAMLSGSRRA